jgi:RecG-like helicase
MLDDYGKLNQEQKRVVDTIVAAARAHVRGERLDNNMFFMEGAAGTGKTFVYKVVYDILSSIGIKVVCMAYTGVAAALLPNGKTLHSALGLPVPLNKDSQSRLQPFMQQ